MEKLDFLLLSVDAIAKSTNYTHEYVSRKFKYYIGKSLKQYVNQARLAQAALLLATSDFSVENIAVGAFGTRCDLRHGKREITNLAWPIPGVVGKSVLGLCAAVGVLCGRSEAQIRAGLEKAARAPMHSKVYAAGEMLFFEDCYNASPEACLAALEGVCLLAGARPRVAVLGDMLELGAYSGILHRTLGASVYKSGVEYLFTYGALAAQIARGAKEAGMAASRIFSFAVGEEQLLAKELHARVPADAAVFYKASRALCMERVIEEVRRFV